MKSATGNFDRLARGYQTLEWLAFGGDLERARFALLPALRSARRLLIPGEGDGRFLEKLVDLNPSAEIDCLDASLAMIERARSRLGERGSHVTFRHADFWQINLPAQHYDAVVTCFFLDCFNSDEAERAVAKIAASLQPHAQWLWVDFALPARGLDRWRAQLWLTLLYTFFRWQTGLQTRRLPPAEAFIVAAGLEPITTQSSQGGLLRSVLFRAPAT